MNAITRLNTLFLSTLLLSGLLATEAFAADGRFEETFAVSEPIVLDASTGSGSIKIRSGSDDEVTVVGEIQVRRRFGWGKPRNGDEIVQQLLDNPPIEMGGGRLRVGHISDRGLRNSVSISYEIVVPTGTEIIAESGSGSITVTDVAAPVDAVAGSGSLVLENIGGPTEARTGSGSIRAEGIAGSFKGKSGSGRIRLEQTAPGDVVVSTGSGSSNLNGVAGSLSASSGSGRITVDGRQEGDWTLDTGSGSIRVSLPEDAAFDLDAESRSGRIDIEHPLTVEGQMSKRHVTGTVRGGGPKLEIETGSGKIRVN
ncbi:MAG: DUF4097 family beta strand repeat-containing protein [Woeseiaceae bacterium]